VHRIDKDTSGLMLLARNEVSHKYYNGLFQQRNLEKHYFGLVSGVFSEDAGVYDQPIEEHPVIPGKMRVGRKGKAAITHYRVLERFRGYSWVAFQIETGRTHQIRVHLAAFKHPLSGDTLYGCDAKLAAKLGLERQWLHAMKLGFIHPTKGEYVSFESTYPEDLAHALEVLRTT
jgi:23S rRNA pseudouridine1911/1915/1917 synthase